MIDTDRYEGHSKGEWEVDVTEIGWDNIIVKDVGVIAQVWLGNDADIRLIADAPLLLAEVKRLREAALTAREVLMKHYEWMSVNDATTCDQDEEILNTVTLLRKASE